jgi:predicted lipase
MGVISFDDLKSSTIHQTLSGEFIFVFRTDKLKKPNPNYEFELQSYNQYLLNIEKYKLDTENFEKDQRIYNEWVRISKKEQEIENAKKILEEVGYEFKTKTH